MKRICLFVIFAFFLTLPVPVLAGHFSSFNLGEFLFPYKIASVLPLAAFWGIWWYWWRKSVCHQQ